MQEVQLADTSGPTHKFGRNLDWSATSKRLPVREVGTEVIPGTDQIGVTLTLGTSGHGALGQRMHSPTPIPTESLEGAGTDDWETKYMRKFGPPPDNRNTIFSRIWVSRPKRGQYNGAGR